VEIVLRELPDDSWISREELAQVVFEVLATHAYGGVSEAAATCRSGGVRRGAFTHIGSITERGRVSHSKFSAVFGTGRYPGSNCGISILGTGA